MNRLGLSTNTYLNQRCKLYRRCLINEKTYCWAEQRAWGVSRVQPTYILSNALLLDQQRGSKGDKKKNNKRKKAFNNHPFISLPALSLVNEPILPKALEVWQLEKAGSWILMGFLSLSEDCWALKQTSVILSKWCWPLWNCF